MSAQQAILELLVMAEEMERRGDDIPDVRSCQAYGSEIKRLAAGIESLRREDLDSVVRLSLEIEKNKIVNRHYDRRIHALFRVLNNIIGYADTLERAKDLAREVMKEDDQIIAEARVEIERFNQHFKV